MPLIWLLAMLLAAPAVHAQAAGTIHRCVDNQGHQIFTDRHCADMQATPALPPPNVPGATAPTPSRQPSAAPELCAASVGALRQQVVDAFATHDPNRIAGLMLWNGYSQHAVVGDIEALHDLVQQPLIDIDDGSSPPSTEPPDIYDVSRPLTELLAPRDGDPEATDAAPPAAQLVLITGLGHGDGSTRETRFALSRQSGCVWMLPPD